MANVVVITGASGLVGRNLAEHFASVRWSVRALVRDASTVSFSSPNITTHRANLPDEIDTSVFEGADVVIHAAYATTETRPDVARDINERGTLRVAALAAKAGVKRFVFVSSLASHPDAKSYYGRSKFILEQKLDASRDLIIRPGFVLARSGGLFERIRQSLETTRFVPVFGGGKAILQTVHIDDLCKAFERALDLDITGALNVAEPEGQSLRQFIKMLAHEMRVPVTFVPVPGEAAASMLRAMEKTGLKLPVNSENVLGALTMRHVATERDLARLGMSVRSAAESLSALFRDDSRRPN